MSRPRKRRRQPDQSSAGPSPTVSTYQTRIAVYAGRDRADGDAGLSAYGELYGRVQRKLFADVAAGQSAASLKNAYLERYGIPARMFNTVRVSLEGKVSAVRESQRLRQDSLRRRIDRAERQVGKADEQGRCQQVHQKRRRLANLKSRQAGLEGDIAAGRVRLPDCLAEQHGKYLVIEGVRFAYGHEQVLAALVSNADYVAHRREHGDKAARATALGQAISYRFKRDGKGWRVFATTESPEVEITTDRRRGAIGVDLNADHLAVAETDASDNYLNAWRVPLVTYGKNTNQTEAIIGNAVTGVVEYAREVGKPIVIEKLDFRQKKAALEGQSRKYSRMLSSFSYGKIKAYFLSRGYRQGVEVHQVNPAFSSVVGRVKFMERYGLTIHQAAALVLARRLLGCSERIPRRWVCPIGNGVQVAFTVPVRKRVKHVWTYWGAITGQLRLALAAQHRRERSHPVRAVVGGKTRAVA